MITKCPHCKKDIVFKDAQKAKIEAALSKLGPGKTLKLGCPLCKKPIELGAEVSKKNQKPEEKKPEKAPPVAPKKAEASKPAPVKATKIELPKPINPPPPAPKPPDLGWLATGEMEGKTVIEDVPTAMILVPEGQLKTDVAATCKEMGFQLFFPKSVDDAIDRMRFKKFDAVVFHCAFENAPFANSVFHEHMCNMSMRTRRYIYYVVIGPDFKTLYDLEALTYSANTVVNDNEADKINVIMKKGKGDYDDLFGPYLAMIKAQGKR